MTPTQIKRLSMVKINKMMLGTELELKVKKLIMDIHTELLENYIHINKYNTLLRGRESATQEINTLRTELSKLRSGQNILKNALFKKFKEPNPFAKKVYYHSEQQST